MNIDYYVYQKSIRCNTVKALEKQIEERKEWLEKLGIKHHDDYQCCMMNQLKSCMITEISAINLKIEEFRAKERAGIDRMMRNNGNKFGGENI